MSGSLGNFPREVYRKVGEPFRWLYVAKNDCWMVGNTRGKEQRRTHSFGAAHSLAKAGGQPPPAGRASGRCGIAAASGSCRR